MRYLPTVTEIIAPWVAFSRVPPNTLQAAAERGTVAHEACANIARGIPVIGLAPEIAGYVESFRRWFELVGSVILVEERLFDEPHGYCGQIDLLVRTTQGEIWLCDLKTPVQLAKSWQLQIAAYRRLCEVNNYSPDCTGSLRLQKDGRAPAMEWYQRSGIRDFSIFLCCLNAYRFFKS